MNNSKNKSYQDLIPFVEFWEGIPKKIYQTYKTKNVSEELLENIQYLKNIHSDWEYKLFDDNDIEDFIIKNYGALILNYYQRINPAYGAARADFFRYLLIYKMGGVYLDIKSSVSQSLNKKLLPNDMLVLSHWDNEDGRQHENWGHYKEIKHIKRGEYQQWHIIAAPGHPFIRAVILQVLENIDTYNPYKAGVGLKGTLKTTGPIAYSTLIDKLCKTFPHNYRLVDGVNDLGLIYSIYEQKHGCYYHKKALNSNYNYKIAPIVDNGVKQNLWYRFYFTQINRRIVHYEHKVDILRRERRLYPSTILFIKSLITNKLYSNK